MVKEYSVTIFTRNKAPFVSTQDARSAASAIRLAMSEIIDYGTFPVDDVTKVKVFTPNTEK